MSVGTPVRLNAPGEKSVFVSATLHAASQIVHRLGAGIVESALGLFAIPGLQDGQVALEAHGVGVGQVVGQRFDASRLGVGAFGGDVKPVRHGGEPIRPFHAPLQESAGRRFSNRRAANGNGLEIDGWIAPQRLSPSMLSAWGIKFAESSRYVC